MLNPEEIQRLKRMELWLRGVLVKYREAWNKNGPDDQSGGSATVANHFTPIVMVAIQAARESINYICDLDEASEVAGENTEPSFKEIVEETDTMLETLHGQWQAIHHANLALLSAWKQLDVDLQINIPPATIDQDDDGKYLVSEPTDCLVH